MSNIQRKHSIDVFYQVSVHLAKRFQRRIFFQKSTNQFVKRSGRNQHPQQRSFHRCFLPSFDSFGQTVSRGKESKKSANQKQESPVAAMFANRSGRDELIFIEDLLQILPTKFRIIWTSGFRGDFAFAIPTLIECQESCC